MDFRIEIFQNGQYKLAAMFYPNGNKHEACQIVYDTDYILERLGHDEQLKDRIGLNFPIQFDSFSFDSWPQFILDYLPQGNARRVLLKKINSDDDQQLLAHGAVTPVGKLRIIHSDTFAQMTRSFDFTGLSLEEVLSKQERFLEDLSINTPNVFGGSDLQGDAPKFFLNLDIHKRYHANTDELFDSIIHESFIIKLPRGRTSEDKLLLKNEAAYWQVAKECGLQVYKDLKWRNDFLFIPRFDLERPKLPDDFKKINLQDLVLSDILARHGQEYTRNFCSNVGLDFEADFNNIHTPSRHWSQTKRHGMESLYSIAGETNNHFDFCAAIIKYSANKCEDLLEYLKRDFLNLTMGNPDNHGRNSALLTIENQVRLAPLFDFAPMIIDPNEIFRRAVTWGEHFEESSTVNWSTVLTELSIKFEIKKDTLIDGLQSFYQQVRQLPSLLERHAIDTSIRKKCVVTYQNNLNSLEEVLSEKT